MATMQFLDLNDDCIVEILRRIPISFISAFAQSCSRISGILQEESLWNYFTYRDFSITELEGSTWRQLYRDLGTYYWDELGKESDIELSENGRVATRSTEPMSHGVLSSNRIRNGSAFTMKLLCIGSYVEVGVCLWRKHLFMGTSFDDSWIITAKTGMGDEFEQGATISMRVTLEKDRKHIDFWNEGKFNCRRLLLEPNEGGLLRNVDRLFACAFLGGAECKIAIGPPRRDIELEPVADTYMYEDPTPAGMRKRVEHEKFIEMERKNEEMRRAIEQAYLNPLAKTRRKMPKQPGGIFKCQF